MQEEVGEILRLIDSLQMEDRETFWFRGICHKLVLAPAESCEKEGAWYEARSATEFDVYVSEELAGSALKRMLFHETMEIHLLQNMDREDAHAIAKRMDEEIFG